MLKYELGEFPINNQRVRLMANKKKTVSSAKRKKRKGRQGKLPFNLKVVTLAIIAIAGLTIPEFEAIKNTFISMVGSVEQAATVHTDEGELVDLEYDGENQVVIVNNNEATFTEEELSLENGSWQEFSNLDRYNRVGVANAMLSKSMMPTEDRESLYVDPTGWKNKKVTIDGESFWLYNRCHLIGFQLTGENNNLKNLMTGTRSLNTPHMLKYENEIANYIKETNNHVRYRVEPIFRDNELVARGIHMQAKSIEDDTINFNVYIFNVQDGVTIDYTDGSSKVTS